MDFPGSPCRNPGVCGFSRGFPRLSPGDRQVPYVLLTRAPVAVGGIAAATLPLDLHVLGLSLAFILSQDQTLRCCYALFYFFLSLSDPRRSCAAAGRGENPRGPWFSRLLHSVCFLISRNRRGLGGGLAPLRSPAVARRATPSSLSYRLVASFQWTLPPLPVGRDCKGNNFFPFRQTTKPGFSAPGTAVPRLRLQRYYQIPQPTKFFNNFFQKNFTPLNQQPVSQHHTSLTFPPTLCPKT